MRFLVDTEVVVEVARPNSEQQVVEWLKAQSPLDIAISVITLGEIEGMLAVLPSGRRRSAMDRWIAEDLPRQFQGRVLAIDAATAREWGKLAARARLTGRELPLVDGLLLATAAVHDLTLVTRHESDCAARGVPVFNPWREKSP